MGSLARPGVKHDLVIDYAAPLPPAGLHFDKQRSFGKITLAHGTLAPNDGMRLGSSQMMVALQDGAPFRMEWRLPDSDRSQAKPILPGQIHLGDGQPLWCRFDGESSFFAFAMDESFVTDIWASAFGDARAGELRMAVGVEDEKIKRLCALAQHELDHGNVGERIFIEGLAVALAIYLRRSYGSSPLHPHAHKGGLAPAQLRRVLEYITAHLDDELGLSDLAAITGLSLHHFGRAFKTTMGSPPHRYVIEQRIARACELLHGNEKTISEIAYATGFSSHSHLTANFHRLKGVTPSQYRHSAA